MLKGSASSPVCKSNVLKKTIQSDLNSETVCFINEDHHQFHKASGCFFFTELCICVKNKCQTRFDFRFELMCVVPEMPWNNELWGKAHLVCFQQKTFSPPTSSCSWSEFSSRFRILWSCSGCSDKSSCTSAWTNVTSSLMSIICQINWNGFLLMKGVCCLSVSLNYFFDIILHLMSIFKPETPGEWLALQ